MKYGDIYNYEGRNKARRDKEQAQMFRVFLITVVAISVLIIIAGILNDINENIMRFAYFVFVVTTGYVAIKTYRG